ncbi:hypothetical protein NLJ89_g2722 [Agrocybe chaxingu]|uniref:DUF6593 domain-containing protein n=1 Tax=Agrocybe chaxingu TaxID=84603 RepID=A0A9W8KAU4_9AGAR|nr:hypothetical protein NLJ89_g2722 [Agrocybe chaxingu]
MHLYLTSNSPWNTTYRTESGQVIYKAESRGLLGPRRIAISKIQPARTINLDADGKVPEEALRDAFTEIGMVEWHAVTYSKIRLYTFDKKDENETLVANFHQQHFGLVGKARPASLEVQPEFNHMADIIVITLIYIEKLRREKAGQTSD